MQVSELTLSQVMRVLWRGRYFLITTAVVISIISCMLSLMMPKTFTTEGVLVVGSSNVAVGDAGGGGASSNDLVRSATEAEFLRSRTLIGEVVQELDLASHPA